MLSCFGFMRILPKRRCRGELLCLSFLVVVGADCVQYFLTEVRSTKDDVCLDNGLIFFQFLQKYLKEIFLCNVTQRRQLT
jgi:hypothetical protein